MQDELLYRFLRCDATPEEERRVLDWIDADIENRRRMDSLQLTFEGLAILGPKVNTCAELRRPSLRSRIVRWTATAAAAAVFAIAGGYFWANYRVEGQMDEIALRQISLSVPAGQRLKVTLEDGTEVWINGGSTLRYPALFSKHSRRVRIDGEAIFEVARNEARPFVVETFAYPVEVLGTRFDVLADSAKNFFSTSVIRGRVRVANHVTLEKNNRVELRGGNLVVDKFFNDDVFMWTEGYVSVCGLGFEELMQRFEKDFGVRIVIECAAVPKVKYNYGKVRIADGIDSALRLLQREARFSFSTRESDGAIVIRGV